MEAAGPAAEMIAWLWWAMLAAGAGLTILVLGLIAWGFRKPATTQPTENFWSVTMGVVFSLAILTTAVAGGVYVGEKLNPTPDDTVPMVDAEARQWAWRFTQTHPEQGDVTRENILFIPAGRPVDIAVTSIDVVHSFWVPRLGGKLDAIPGHVNILRLQADAPGRYSGQSAEFSGVGYGAMRFDVIAYDPDDVPDFTTYDPAMAEAAQ